MSSKPKPNAPKEAPRRAKDLTYVLRSLFPYLKQQRYAFMLAFCLMFVGNILQLFGPRLAGSAIDAMKDLQAASSLWPVFRLALAMWLAYVISAIVSYINARLMVRSSQNLVRRMRQDLYEHLLHLPAAFFDRKASGELVSHMCYDIDTVNASLSSDLLQLGASIISVVGALIMMLSLSWKLSLVFLITLPLSILFTRFRSHLVKPLFRRRSLSLAKLNAYVEEIIQGQRAIHVYHRQKNFIDLFAQHNEEAVTAYYRAECLSSMTGPIVSFLSNLSLVLVSVVGAWLFLLGQVPLGALSAFVLYSRRFSGPINEVGNLVADLQSAAAAAERVFALLDEAPEAPDAPAASKLPTADIQGHIRFEDVSFAYGDGPEVLHHLSFDSPPGYTTAIVGQTGAGKSSLIALLMRFYDPTEGRIKLDGRDIQQLTRQSVRQAFTIVMQDSWIFEGTVAENIAYCYPEASRAEIIAAAQAAQADDFIRRLPNGYDCLLSSTGVQLSQGQKQLLAIARATLSPAPILILDEATSHVDSASESKIQEALDQLLTHRSAIVIAHRLSTIERADQILVIEDGRIIEQGTHTELLAANQSYAALYRAQFS